MVIHSFADLRASIPLARKERARELRMIDLLRIGYRDLMNDAKMFGVSTRGNYADVVNRVHKHIWQQIYDR